MRTTFRFDLWRPVLGSWAISLCPLVLAAACAAPGGPDGTNLPAGPLQLAWTFSTEGELDFPPLPVGDVIVVAPSDGPLTALDMESGRLRWHYGLAGGVWSRAIATDGERVFVGLKGGKLAALDAVTGKVRWTRELGIESQVPAWVAGGIVYVPTTFVGPELQPIVEGKAILFALDAQDGSVRWTFETDNYILQTPVAVDDAIYVGGNFADPRPVDEGGHTRIYALSTDGRTIRWTYESEDGFPKRLQATDEVLVFIGYQDYLNAVDARTGELRWRRDTGNWVPMFLAIDDTLYYGAANTVVQALAGQTGEVLWEYNLGGGSFNYVLGAPEFAEGRLYLLTQRGDLVALDSADGGLLWQVPTGIRARSGLRAANGWLFASGTEGTVYAYRLES